MSTEEKREKTFEELVKEEQKNSKGGRRLGGAQNPRNQSANAGGKPDAGKKWIRATGRRPKNSQGPRRQNRSPAPRRVEVNKPSAPPKQTIVQDKKTLQIHNLHPEITNKDLRELAVTYGAVEFCNIQYTSRGESKEKGLITYRSEQNASKARDELNGATLEGRTIEVDFHSKKQIVERVRKEISKANDRPRNNNNSNNNNRNNDRDNNFDGERRNDRPRFRRNRNNNNNNNNNNSNGNNNNNNNNFRNRNGGGRRRGGFRGGNQYRSNKSIRTFQNQK